MKTKAFTLVEFLVVIAIVAILAAIIFPLIGMAANGGPVSQFDGCVNPKVVSMTSATNPNSLELNKVETIYLYQCEDGRQISSTTAPQDLPH